MLKRNVLVTVTIIDSVHIFENVDVDVMPGSIVVSQDGATVMVVALDFTRSGR